MTEMVQLQFISHFTDSISYVGSVRIALEGGCRWIQLRMKGAEDADFIETAKTVRSLCDSFGATMIIDDRVHLVGTVGADGVHLGKNDMPVARAREILGPDKIIGGTANTIEDVRMHYEAGADYIGCGPFRFTATKEKLSPVLGPEGYRNITAAMRREGIDIPIVAIGGITAADIPQLMDCGVSGIAISGSVLRAEDPVSEMRKIDTTIRQALCSRTN